MVFFKNRTNDGMAFELAGGANNTTKNPTTIVCHQKILLLIVSNVWNKD